jgi:hypothetical protein
LVVAGFRGDQVNEPLHLRPYVARR